MKKLLLIFILCGCALTVDPVVKPDENKGNAPLKQPVDNWGGK